MAFQDAWHIRPKLAAQVSRPYSGFFRSGRVPALSARHLAPHRTPQGEGAPQRAGPAHLRPQPSAPCDPHQADRHHPRRGGVTRCLAEPEPRGVPPYPPLGSDQESAALAVVHSCPMRSALLLVVLLVGCSDSRPLQDPIGPTGPTPIPSSSGWTLSGTVVATQNAAPIRGATIAPFGVTTNDAGTFSASGTFVRATGLPEPIELREDESV